MKTVILWCLCVAAFTVPARAQDAFDLHAAVIHNSPGNIADWPATYPITRITMSTPDGLSISSPARDHWPDFIPPEWKGALQYTVWACVRADQWHCSGFIQMWKDRPNTGAPILSDWNKNWAYDAGRWGPMATYVPHVGDQMAFFLSAGDARGNGGVSPGSVRERTNVVLVTLPDRDTGVFDFNVAPAPAPVPQPVPVPTCPPGYTYVSGGCFPPPPVVLPPSAPPSSSLDWQALMASIQILVDTQREMLVISKDTNIRVQNMDRTLTQTLGAFSKFAAKYIAPAIGGFFVAKQFGKSSAVAPAQ